mgnify:CR=1 FL=1
MTMLQHLSMAKAVRKEKDSRKEKESFSPKERTKERTLERDSMKKEVSLEKVLPMRPVLSPRLGHLQPLMGSVRLGNSPMEWTSTGCLVWRRLVVAESILLWQLWTVGTESESTLPIRKA